MEFLIINIMFILKYYILVIILLFRYKSAIKIITIGRKQIILQLEIIENNFIPSKAISRCYLETFSLLFLD